MPQRLLEEFADFSRDWFWEMDADLRFTFISSQMQEITGLDPASMLGKRREEIIVGGMDPQKLANHLADLQARRPFEDFAYKLRCQSGDVHDLCLAGAPFFDESGMFQGYRGITRDLTEQQAAMKRISNQDRELRVRDAMFAQVERLAHIGAWQINLNTDEIGWSDEIFRIYQLPTGCPLSFGIMMSGFPEEVHRRLRTAMTAARDNGERFDLTLPFLTSEKQQRWVRMVGEADVVNGTTERLFGTLQDVTEARRREEHITKLAHTDTLTSLSNRMAFHEQLHDAIWQASVNNSKVILLLIDLDGMKEINDHFGHMAGDEVLKTTASRLMEMCRHGDQVARLGGDEFAVIISDVENNQDPEALGQRLMRGLSFPAKYKDQLLDLSLSIGAAVFPDHARSVEALMRNTDLALHQAKRTGRSLSCVYRQHFTLDFSTRMTSLINFKQALKAGDIQPHYQPIICLETNTVYGFEALVRWHDKKRGILSPAAFSAVFEDATMLSALSSYILEWVTSDMRAWTSAGIEFQKVSVNVTGAQLCDTGFSKRIVDLLDERSLKGSNLVLELTETSLLDDKNGQIGAQLKTLSRSGIKIALDDFGTGYSSLTHLLDIPVDIVKIDKSFIDDLNHASDKFAIVKSVIALGKALGYTTIAEGVESPDQQAILNQIGCKRIQGYLYSQPIQSRQVPQFIEGFSMDNYQASSEPGSDEAAA